ncbi:transposase family protein, partial [uncultured Dubosiella sp.]
MSKSQSVMPVFSVDDFLFGHDLMDDPDQKSYFDKESNSLHLFKCQKKSVHPVCPYCGEEATRTNGWERRTCQLFPIHGFSVFLHIRQRR